VGGGGSEKATLRMARGDVVGLPMHEEPGVTLQRKTNEMSGIDEKRLLPPVVFVLVALVVVGYLAFSATVATASGPYSCCGTNNCDDLKAKEACPDGQEDCQAGRECCELKCNDPDF